MLVTQRRPRRYSLSRRALGLGGGSSFVSFEQRSPNVLPVPTGGDVSGLVNPDTTAAATPQTSPDVVATPADAAAAAAASAPRAGGVLGARDASGASTGRLVGSEANPNPIPTAVNASKEFITERKAGDTRAASALTAPNVYVGGGGQGAPGQKFQGVQGGAAAFNANADKPIVGAPGGLDQPSQTIPNAGAGTRNTPIGFSADADTIKKYLANLGVTLLDQGGPLDEPFVGVGMRTGRMHFIDYPSTVTPQKVTPMNDDTEAGPSRAERIPSAPAMRSRGA